MYKFQVLRKFGIRGKGYSSPDNYLIKNMKVVHIFAATAWAGGALAMQALSVLKLYPPDPLLVPIIQDCLHFVDTWVVIPGLFGCILTGLFYSLVTSIGFFKFAWIGYKWVISLSACFWGLLFWGPYGDQLIRYLAEFGWDWPLRFIRSFILPESVWQGAVQFVLILSMCSISVYRPLSFLKPKQKKSATETKKTGVMPALAFGQEKAVHPTAQASDFWFTPKALNEALAYKTPPDQHELEDIYAKSLSITPLTIPEIATLMRVTDKEQLEHLYNMAFKVKEKVYGERIVLSAPLHVGNRCNSDCLYCANRLSNTVLERKYMSLQEMYESGLNLARQGHKRVFLVTGQLPNADIEFLVGAIQVLYSINDNGNEIRSVNVNVGALSSEDYAVLQEADVGTVLIYQDTYHETSYHTAHPSGIKSDFLKRLNAPETALAAGIMDTGLGLVLGLGPWQFDILAIAQHAAHLKQAYGTGGRTISMHRLRPAPGCNFPTPYPVNDTDYLRCVAITRLAVPYTGIILTSKEPHGLWREGCGAGASQLLTGSVANPYTTAEVLPGEKLPLPLGEECHVEEIVRFLLEDARQLPSFCAACARIGRKGSLYTKMVSQGHMRTQCGPNSISTFMEYLQTYAAPDTKRIGLRLINEKLAKMTDLEQKRAKRLMERIIKGTHDEFV